MKSPPLDATPTAARQRPQNGYIKSLSLKRAVEKNSFHHIISIRLRKSKGKRPYRNMKQHPPTYQHTLVWHLSTKWWMKTRSGHKLLWLNNFPIIVQSTVYWATPPPHLALAPSASSSPSCAPSRYAVWLFRCLRRYGWTPGGWRDRLMAEPLRWGRLTPGLHTDKQPLGFPDWSVHARIWFCC